MLYRAGRLLVVTEMPKSGVTMDKVFDENLTSYNIHRTGVCR